MNEWQWTAVVLGAGVGTYALRAAPFLYEWFREAGRRHVRCLTYISFAVAAGIVSRAIFLDEGRLQLGADAWIKVLAIVAALALYRATRNMPLALFSAVGLAVVVRYVAALGVS